MLLGGSYTCQQCGCGSPCASECNVYDAPFMGHNTTDPVNWLASQFLTGDTGRIITSIALRMYSGWTVQPPPSFIAPKLDIYGNSTTSGGIPDVLGGVLHSLTSYTLASNVLTFTTVGYTVAANTYYWVVLKNQGTWIYTDHNPCISGLEPYCQLRWADGGSSGQIWNAYDGNPYVFKIFGDDI